MRSSLRKTRLASFFKEVRATLILLKEEGRGTRNGYEASKGSKGISGL